MMENTKMNDVIVDVVEEAAEVIKIEDISKSNIVEAVKSLAMASKQKFDNLESDEIGLEQRIDHTIGEITNLNETVASIQKNVKELTIGCYGLAAVTGLAIGVAGGLYFMNKSSKKNTEEKVNTENKVEE